MTLNINKGIRFLKSYLKENGINIAELEYDDFKSWLERQVWFKRNDYVFQQRCKIRDKKKVNHKKLTKLHRGVKEASENFAKSPNKERLEELDKLISRCHKAIEGLSNFLENAPEKKRQSSTDKLKEFCKTLDTHLREQEQILQDTPEREILTKAHDDLEKFRKKIGLVVDEQHLSGLLKQLGQRSSKAGSSFEEEVFPAVQKHILPILAKKIREREQNSFRASDLIPLSGATLGCARAEIDYLIVRRFSDPQQPVEVAGIVEVKRNINDVSSGFELRQENISWFTRDETGYESSMYRTKVFRNGHFDRPAYHQLGEEKLCFDETSFRHFKRDESGYFLENLFFIARENRLTGLRSSESSKIVYRISTDTRFDVEDSEFVEGLMNWIQATISPLQTRDIIELYTSDIEYGQQFIVVEKAKKTK